MAKNPYDVNRLPKMYRDCMTPDATWRRCRPFWRSKSPEDEARKRNDELLDARGEEVTLLTRKNKGDDVIDRVLPPVKNNFVSALPLNLVFVYDGHFSDNQSGILSDAMNAQRPFHRDPEIRPRVGADRAEAIVIAKRPKTGETNFLYVGNRNQFSNLSIKLFTRLKSDNVIWEYSAGNNVWLPIPMLDSSGSTLQESGRMLFDPIFFSAWRLDYVNKEQAFWVRARIDVNTEGQASALLLVTEHIIQSTTVWTPGNDPTLYPNDKCVTVKVNGKIFNRVYDINQLDYSQESFVLLRRQQLTDDCPLDSNESNECGLNPFDTCETDPLEHVKELGTDSLRETIRKRELAFLYNQVSREKQKAADNPVILLFTRNLRLDNARITATYTNMCPCNAYGHFQPIRNVDEPDESICGLCLGTEFVNGYERYVNPDSTNGKILMSFPAAPFDMPPEEHGIGRVHELTTARASFKPKIFIRDLVIRYNEFGEETLRYVVDTRTDSIGRRGVLLHQEMVLKALDPNKIEYRIQVPDLPLAPNQNQVLISLGVSVPQVPGLTPCEDVRLQKGICKPREDNRE